MSCREPEWCLTPSIISIPAIIICLAIMIAIPFLMNTELIPSVITVTIPTTPLIIILFYISLISVLIYEWLKERKEKSRGEK